MEEPRYQEQLYGEISAMTQVNRLTDPLVVLLGRTDLHHRLISGSDYPLPATNVVIQTRALVRYGPAFLPSSVWQEHPPSKGYDEPLAGAPPTGVDGPRFVGSSGRS